MIPVFSVNLSMASWVFLMRASLHQNDRRMATVAGVAGCSCPGPANTAAPTATRAMTAQMMRFILPSFGKQDV
jgi:hypothetical protein